jgi:2-polyprenyl-6-methoxyphenol hydroxylase-like FAD-dependent oxidoreductase
MAGNSGAATVLGKRAVVVGAGMGGMMAADVLSRTFEEVLILEKDTCRRDAGGPSRPEAGITNVGRTPASRRLGPPAAGWPSMDREDISPSGTEEAEARDASAAMNSTDGLVQGESPLRFAAQMRCSAPPPFSLTRKRGRKNHQLTSAMIAA